VEIGWDNLHVIESGGAEMIGDPPCAAFDIGLVLALGADAGNAQKFAKLRQMLVARRVNKVGKIHKRPSGDMSPFQYEYAQLDTNVLPPRNDCGAADDLPWPLTIIL
jgi:hypothetical protein